MLEGILIQVLIIVLFASVVMGLTGFGFALIALPLLILFLPFKVAVPLITVCSVFLNAYMLHTVRRSVQIRRILPLTVMGILGMITGTYFLVSVEITTLKLLIGLVVILFAAAFLSGFGWKIKNERLAFVPVGFLSGLLGGAMSISGPPIVLFFSNQGMEKKTFRANLIVYFLGLYLATTLNYFISGLVSTELLQYAVYMVPVLIIGTMLGIRLYKVVDEALFRKITLILVLIKGFMTILSGSGII
jgi:uncharacterized membrane protein YfcA